MNRPGPPIVKLRRLEMRIIYVMETKICNVCGQEKPLTEFNFRDKRKGTYRAQCKECLHKRKNELYQIRYKERYRDRLKENKNKHRLLIRNLVTELKSCGCCVCGEKDPCCLDFHHLGDKVFNVGNCNDVTVDTLLKEVSKCVVLCANCHRKLHANKLKIYKQMTIKFKKILEKAVQPVRTNGAGYNLVATDIATDVNERGQVNIVYRTGIGVEIPEGYVGIINTPSDIYKKTIRMCSSPILSGNIDEEVIVRYMNTTDVVPAVYKDGDVIANLVIVKAEDAEFEELIDMTEQSATEDDQSLPETEGEPINSEQPDTVSGGEANVPEQAQ